MAIQVVPAPTPTPTATEYAFSDADAARLIALPAPDFTLAYSDGNRARITSPQ